MTSRHATAPTLPVENPLPRGGTAPTRGPQLVQPDPAEERRILRRATLQQNVELLVWLAYMVVVGLGIAGHEPWADEAQAWLLARDQGFWHLMLHAIRYEGSPGLWHALLWALVRLHVSYTGMHWVSGAIAVAGIYVFLRWSPFPLILRILLPFGFWFAYQDAVVARSYVLYAVLAFSAAAILRAVAQRDPGLPIPRSSYVGLAVLLGLMANLSVHGFVASLGFAFVAWVVLRRRSRAAAPARKAVPIAPISALILCCFWLVAILSTIPPRDADFVAGVNFQRSIHRVLVKVDKQHAGSPIPIPREDVRPGELAPVVIPARHETARQAFWNKIARLLALITYPVSNFRWFALAVCVLVVAHAIVFRAGPDGSGQLGWVGLIPWVFMVLVFTSMYLAPRHAGMLWESLVASLWLTWPAQPPSTPTRRWLHRVTLAALVLVACDQIWWTAHCVWADLHGPYSGDVALAKFIAAQPPGTRIAGFYYHSIGVAAYSSHPIYFNQPTTYWPWNRNVRTDQQAPATIATHPAMIVVGRMRLSQRNGNITDDWIAPDPTIPDLDPFNDDYGILPYAEAHGYRETHRFCGDSFMRDRYAEHLCQFVLQPAPPPPTLQPAP